MDEQLQELREAGWVVAIHNDYRLAGTAQTFYLMTNGDRCVRGEGRSDGIALARCSEAIQELEAREAAAKAEVEKLRGDVKYAYSQLAEYDNYGSDDLSVCVREISRVVSEQASKITELMRARDIAAAEVALAYRRYEAASGQCAMNGACFDIAAEKRVAAGDLTVRCRSGEQMLARMVELERVALRYRTVETVCELLLKAWADSLAERVG